MISVCIATYNGGKYIREQISSILPQLDTDDEIIVSDDGSNDNTISIIKDLKDRRINIIDGAHRKSPIWNFEKAIQNAKGDYIFLADQDDVWQEDKVKISLEYLKKYDCIISDAIVVDADLNTTNDSFFALNNTKDGKIYNLLVKNGYLGCCMAFNRKVLESSLPFPDKTPMHDIWIGNVACFKHTVKFIPEKLILFRRHNNNSSSTARKSYYSIYNRIMFRWVVIRGLISSFLKK